MRGREPDNAGSQTEPEWLPRIRLVQHKGGVNEFGSEVMTHVTYRHLLKFTIQHPLRFELVRLC